MPFVLGKRKESTSALILINNRSMESLERLLNQKDDDSFLKKLHETQWLYHVKSVLVGAVKVLSKLEVEGITVFVHCSDGWDRTSQIAS